MNSSRTVVVQLSDFFITTVSIMWVDKNEFSSFWLPGVLTDFKARGVNDMLVTVTDNLNGFTDTIKSVFPELTTQICMVYQIRNSCRYVVWKEKKVFTKFD